MLAKELSAILAQRALEIAEMLFPNGKKEGNEWCVGSIHGEAGRSLKIHLTGPKAGVWMDFAGGESGDLLDLWALIHTQTIAKTMEQACNYLNISPKKHELKRKSKVFEKPPVRAVEDIKNKSAAYVYLTKRRCLQDATIRLYGIPNSDSEIIFNYMRDDELIFVKTLKLERKSEKKEMYVSPNCEPCLFGWHMIPSKARTVVICEGEIDAMSFYQYGIPALSVPFGGGKGDKQRWIEYEYDNLNRFDEIFVCMDNDESGCDGAKEIIERLGAHRCRLVELPMKDANECLVNGINASDMHYFLEQSKTLDPEELCNFPQFRSESEEMINPISGKFVGYNLGWNKCADSILFRPSGLTMWTGYNGHGKTLFLSFVMLNIIKQGARVCIASMELFPAELCARIYLQASAQEKPTSGFMDKIDEWLDRKLFIFNLVGTGKIDKLLEVFLYAKRRYGVDVFVIDSLTTLNIAEDDYNGQKDLIERLRDFKIDNKCHIHLVAHPRKPRDESVIPGKYDIRGGSAISDLADNCLTVWRNKIKESYVRMKARGYALDSQELEELKKPDCYLKCDKNRHGRSDFKEGIYGFWFHDPTFQYLEDEGLKPKPFIEYSCLNDD